jgi:peptidoglycan/xylan/chitin deacetylase (PgdA/CDA1 family)
MYWSDRLLALACRLKRGGVIVNYHTLNAEQTRQQIALLGRYFDFIHHRDLDERLERPGKRPFCLMTFDDGKKSNVTETALELARLGVPAVFYIVTKFASGELPVLWFDAYREFLAELGKCPAGLETQELKRLPHSEREERLSNAYRTHRFQPKLDGEHIRAMNWDDVRRLHRQGHTIGAHSETHAILTTAPLGEAQSEIARSIAKVAEELGEPCVSFAFPNGNHSEALARYALGCGVRTVMTTEPAWAGRAEQPWRLPRLQIHETQGLARHELKLVVAALGCLLGNPDGSGRRYVRNRLWRAAESLSPASRVTENSSRRQEPTPAEERTALRSAGD